MKLLGALLILVGSVSGGLRLCAEKRRRTLCLGELLRGLELLRGELQLRALSLPELLPRLGRELNGDTGAFFRGLSAEFSRLGEESFSQLWLREERRCFSCLDQAEAEELQRLGTVLGRLELEAQLGAIDSCLAFLGSRREEALRSYPEQKRLLLGLSAAAGLLAMILMS